MKALLGWLLNSRSSMNGHTGVHGCGLKDVVRSTMFGTDVACMVGTTVLTAVGKLTVWVLASAVVKVPTSGWLLVVWVDWHV